MTESFKKETTDAKIEEKAVTESHEVKSTNIKTDDDNISHSSRIPSEVSTDIFGTSDHSESHSFNSRQASSTFDHNSYIRKQDSLTLTHNVKNSEHLLTELWGQLMLDRVIAVLTLVLASSFGHIAFQVNKYFFNL